MIRDDNTAAAEAQNFEAFLHIVHVSDIHCRSAAGPTDLRAERRMQALVALLRRVSPARADAIRRLWEEGLAGHDPDAHDAFCAFLKWFVKDPEFRGITSWLLDSGDLTSMGDSASLSVAQGWLRDYAAILNDADTLMLYGNHDAWPAKFPLFASAPEIQHHRIALRTQHFPGGWPQGPLAMNVPHTGSRVLLYGLNSTIDDRWLNTLARGEVALDPWWELPVTANDQLAQLEHKMDAGLAADSGIRDFRILAVHHPVHYPDRPSFQMSLLNDVDVADALIRYDAKGRGKLAHLVLSGHTHVPHPQRGQLPTTAVGAVCAPLTTGQLQLIAGSLSQMPRDEARQAATAKTFVPHQCQILTLWASVNRPGTLRIERRIAGRPGGTGPYRFLPPGVEAVTIDY